MANTKLKYKKKMSQVQGDRSHYLANYLGKNTGRQRWHPIQQRISLSINCLFIFYVRRINEREHQLQPNPFQWVGDYSRSVAPRDVSTWQSNKTPKFQEKKKEIHSRCISNIVPFIFLSTAKVNQPWYVSLIMKRRKERKKIKNNNKRMRAIGSRVFRWEL